MPKKVCKLVYQFDELSDKAKEKARDWYREASTWDEWWDGVYQNAEDAAKYIGIEFDKKPVKLMNDTTRYDSCIYFSGFSSQGDGACFEGAWHASAVNAEKLKKDFTSDTELHRIADGFAEIANKYPDASFTVKHSGHYSHKYCTDFDVYLTEDEDETLHKQLAEDEDALIELARDFMEWIYRSLEREYEYLNADEQVDESIRANDYEFNENGTRA